MDELLLGYALNALDPADAAAVEAHLAANPADRAKIDRARRLLAPLTAECDEFAPPPGLALDAIARVAQHIVATESPSRESVTVPAPPRTADTPVFVGRRRADVVVAAGIALLATGMILGGVQKLRRDSQFVACQNNLRALYQGLSGYADANDGKFPQVGTPAAPMAGGFATVLADAGQYPRELKLACPSAGDVPAELAAFVPGAGPPSSGALAQIGYVYTLGYRGPDGTVIGLRRGDAADGQTPLAADLPAATVAPASGPVSPHGRGQNVLFATGAVRYFTAATVGPYGDDIYRNDNGRVRAGLHHLDASLGRAVDLP